MVGKENFVTPVDAVQYQEGEVCLAEDAAIHRISNESLSDDLVTLHVYSPPLHMNLYCLDATETQPAPH